MQKNNKINFCPNPGCVNHIDKKQDHSWYIKVGWYQTNTFGSVQRYKCRDCRTKFSDQTFQLDYYAKKKVDYRLIMCQLIGRRGIRQMSRFMQVSCGTISNRILRLSLEEPALHVKKTKKYLSQ